MELLQAEKIIALVSWQWALEGDEKNEGVTVCSKEKSLKHCY